MVCDREIQRGQGNEKKKGEIFGWPCPKKLFQWDLEPNNEKNDKAQDQGVGDEHMDIFRKELGEREIGKGQLARPGVETAMKSALERENDENKRQQKSKDFCWMKPLM